MLSLIVVVIAGLLTSSLAIAFAGTSDSAKHPRRRSKSFIAAQICATGAALGAVLMVIHLQLGG